MSGFDQRKLVVVAGMPRGGTTSLYHIFEGHPGTFVPFRKETAYFSYNYFKGEDWFRDLYADRTGDQPAFDISPQYFNDLRVIDRIKALAPDAKVILSVRDPVEWSISSFFQTNKFEKKPSFRDFLDGYTVTTAKEVMHFQLADGYVQKAIESYSQAFGQNLLLYRFELFKSDPIRVLNAIEKFIGIAPYFNHDTYVETKVNSGYQRNLRLLTWVLSRESVISAIDTVFPRSIIRRVRLAVDKITMPKEAPQKSGISAEDRALAERRLAADRAWVDALFVDKAIQLGDGTLFEEKCDLFPENVAI